MTTKPGIDCEPAAEDSRMLLVQLHQVQEELEEHFLANRQLTADLERSRADTASLQAQLLALRSQLAHMQAELATKSGSGPGTPNPSVVRRMARRMLRRSPPALEGDRAGMRNKGEDARALRQSTWFDAEWYLENYPDVAAAGIDPVIHYLEHGALEGRDPGPRFSTTYYLGANADVAAAGMNPLLHFLLHGLVEGRAPKA